MQSFWLVAILATGILMMDGPARAATRGYIVSPEGLLLTLDADTDTVIGVREIPNLASEEGAGRRPQRSNVAQAPRIREVSRAIGDDTATTGRSLITPQGDRLLVLDPLPYGLPRGFLIDEGPTGRIFVYDAVTGAKLGHVAFFAGGGDRLAAVHPRGDKAYVASEGPRSDRSALSLVCGTQRPHGDGPAPASA
jgi:hypothetical protein